MNHPRSAFGASPSRGRRQRPGRAGPAAAAWLQPFIRPAGATQARANRAALKALLDGAVAYARECGATFVEAYPVDKPERTKGDFIWFGAKSMFDAAGFVEVARRKPERPVVRLALAGR